MKQTISYGILGVLLLGVTTGAQQPTPPPPVPAPQGDQPPVTFRVEINYVEVDAIVTDEQGKVVTDLKQDDFVVLEDGKPQKVSTFARVDIPIERAEQPLFKAGARPLEPDVVNNVVGHDGRVYVILLDDLHTAPLRSQRVRAAAKQFIERNLGANDTAAVVYTSGRAEAGQDFTSSKRLLAASVDKFMGRNLRSATLEKIDQYNMTAGLNSGSSTGGSSSAIDRITDPLDAERGYQARQALDAIRNVATFMDGIRGRRKALVYVGEGIDYDINDVMGTNGARDAGAIMDATRDAIGAAQRSNVSIYAVDARGLYGMGDETMEVSDFPADTSLGLDSRALANELRLSQDSLRILADETGGFAVVNRNDFSTAFGRIVADNSRYYVLGYYPTNDRRDGRFRKIEVKVARPGLKVRSRKGYVAPRGKPATDATKTDETTAALRDALNSPLPIAGLPMTATMAVFRGTAPKEAVTISVHVLTNGFKFADRNGAFANDLEVSFWAIDPQGKIAGGDRHSVQMALKPETLKRVQQFGFRVVSAFEVPPGRYSVRLAARETGGGQVGSVIYDLEVPDFAKAPMSMSHVLLTSASAGLAPTARPKADTLGRALPGPPTTYRVFLPQDELAAYAEVYDNTGTQAHKVNLAATVQDESGRTVFQANEERASSELQGARGGYGFGFRVPLKDFKPGLYVLKVEGRSQVGAGASTSREVPFRIVSPTGGTGQ